MAKRLVSDLDVKGKKVIVRVDFNVPHKGEVITDDNRIVAALPTIKYLVENGAKTILMSHLGKVDYKKTPEEIEAAKKKNDMSIVAKKLAEYLPETKVVFVNATRGEELENAVAALEDGQVLLMQNTRYEKGESKNDPELAKYWASLGDMFVIDAFGSVHRAHASTVGIPTNLHPAVAGFLLEKEIAYIGKAVSDPERPLVAILGGSKVSSKIGVIENLLKVADKVIIGGGMMFTFWKAKGLEVGNSLVEEDKVELAKEYLEKGADKLVLPVDAVVNNAFAAEGDIKTVEGNVPEGYMGLDIGPKSIELIKENLAGVKTVIWNGPMGVFEMEPFAKGTLAVCEMLANMPDANTIIGGGDSAAAVKQLGFADKVSHISTGGGASLEYMEGKVLPGIAAVDDK